MGIEISFELNDQDLEHFRAMASQAQAALESGVDETTILTGCRELLETAASQAGGQISKGIVKMKIKRQSLYPRIKRFTISDALDAVKYMHFGKTGRDRCESRFRCLVENPSAVHRPRYDQEKEARPADSGDRSCG